MVDTPGTRDANDDAARSDAPECEVVAIVGASPNRERYANMAMHALLDAGYDVVLVNPKHRAIEGRVCHKSLRHVGRPIDTVTLYVGPGILTTIAPDLVEARPGRVIMNPGTESDAIAAHLEQAGIRVVKACTLVLLRLGQFSEA